MYNLLLLGHCRSVTHLFCWVTVQTVCLRSTFIPDKFLLAKSTRLWVSSILRLSEIWYSISDRFLRLSQHKNKEKVMCYSKGGKTTTTQVSVASNISVSMMMHRNMPSIKRKPYTPQRKKRTKLCKCTSYIYYRTTLSTPKLGTGIKNKNSLHYLVKHY